jgi:hypothetical protein
LTGLPGSSGLNGFKKSMIDSFIDSFISLFFNKYRNRLETVFRSRDFIAIADPVQIGRGQVPTAAIGGRGCSGRLRGRFAAIHPHGVFIIIGSF